MTGNASNRTVAIQTGGNTCQQVSSAPARLPGAPEAALSAIEGQMSACPQSTTSETSTNRLVAHPGGWRTLFVTN